MRILRLLDPGRKHSLSILRQRIVTTSTNDGACETRSTPMFARLCVDVWTRRFAVLRARNRVCDMEHPHGILDDEVAWLKVSTDAVQTVLHRDRDLVRDVFEQFEIFLREVIRLRAAHARDAELASMRAE